MISIIVPVLNEEATIGATLDHLMRACPDCEILVVDGGSTDQTADIAQRYARVLVSTPGRGQQMNVGAAAAAGDILWFVHADTEVDPKADSQIRQALADPATIGGGLTLAFHDSSLSLAIVAGLSNLRARTLHWIFGDQSLFVRRSVFESLGGFPVLPLMEDLEMSRRLNRCGRLVLLDAMSRTSARRFRDGGTWRVLWRMQCLKAGYLLGVPAAKLHARYVQTTPKRR